jgi:hypothetical protein
VLYFVVKSLEEGGQKYLESVPFGQIIFVLIIMIIILLLLLLLLLVVVVVVVVVSDSRDSPVGIATGLRAGRTRNLVQFPSVAKDFSVYLNVLAGSVVHPVSH